MSKDIRISTTFIHHPKTIKLKTRLGTEGLVSLITLWSFAGEYRPKGSLHKMNAEDIAIASQWSGDPLLFVKTLEELGWVDRKDDVLHIHDWEEHNGYAFYGDERKRRAKNAAAVRWANRDKATSNAGGISGSNARSNAKCNAPSPAPSPAPTPTPSPSPTPKINTLAKLKAAKEELIASALEKYPDKNCRKAMDDFIEACEIKGYDYKKYNMAYFRWVREDNYNKYGGKKHATGYVDKPHTKGF